MIHAEYNEQTTLFAWIRLNERYDKRLSYAFSSQSGEKFKSKLAGARAKKAGMLAGIPDVFLPYPNKQYAGLWIELKRRIVKGQGKPTLSEAQKICLQYFNEVGYKAIVCYGADEAIQAIKDYLNE